MKVILHDKNIVVRVVLETDSDYSYHDERGEGYTVANNFSVTAGNYVDNLDASSITAREATLQDYIDRQGSLSIMPGSLLKPFFVGIDITQESEDSIAAIAAIPNSDIDLLDADCFLYSLTDDTKRAVFNAFGIIDFQVVYDRNSQYHLVVETTTTTTAIPE